MFAGAAASPEGVSFHCLLFTRFHPVSTAALYCSAPRSQFHNRFRIRSQPLPEWEGGEGGGEGGMGGDVQQLMTASASWLASSPAGSSRSIKGRKAGGKCPAGRTECALIQTAAQQGSGIENEGGAFLSFFHLGSSG